MGNNKVLYIVIAILGLAVIGGGLFFFLGNQDAQKENEVIASPSITPVVDQTTMVDCSKTSDPSCFLNRMNGCLPVTTVMTGSDDKTAIEITVLGIEDDKCHFQRKIDNVLNMDCYFPRGTLNMDTLDQTFGNDKGLQKVVDDACKPVGW